MSSSIIMLSDCYQPYKNGVVTSIDTFTNTLRQKGSRVIILTSDHKSKDIFYDSVNMVYRFPAVAWPMHSNFSLPLPFLDWQKRNIVYKNDFDVVHSHSFMTMGVLAQHISKHIKAPLIVTYHTMMDEYTHYVPIIPSNAVIKVAHEATYRYCAGCDHVIVPSKNVYDKMKALDITTPMSVLPTGIDLEEIDGVETADLTKYGVPQNAKVVAYVGRVAKEKNLHLLLDAYGTLAARMEDVHLVMVGGGPQYDEFVERYSDHPLKDRVHFTNFLPKQEAIGVFKAADIMLFTSQTETQGIVLAESMASSTPIVAADSFAAQDIIENGVEGALCEHNKEDLADACYQILNDEATLNRMKSAARKRGETYDTRLLTDKLLTIYEEAKIYRAKNPKKSIF